LYSIAWRHGLDYRELATWNRIGPDFKLAVGQVLILHRPASSNAASLPSAAEAPAAGSPAAGLPAAPHAAPRGSVPPRDGPPGSASLRSAQPPPMAAALPGAGLHWVWPTDHVSAPRPVPGGGILLLGRLGQDVRAAGAGKVVYTGSGIRGYGNLIIIKHGDSLLTSYAHNREILVQEGQQVSMGQTIAHMGQGPHQISALYFEIRVNGRPTDPLRYLSPPG
jgi:lipoprotein NlpD